MPSRPPTHASLMRAQHAESFPSRHAQDHEQRRADPVQAEADRLRASWRWRNLRRAFLERHPLCALCLRDGVTRPARVVDHVVPARVLVEQGTPERVFDVSNLQGLCDPHDDAKSAAERRR